MPSLNELLRLLGIQEVRDLTKDGAADKIAKAIGGIIEKEAKPLIRAALSNENVDKALDYLKSINHPDLQKIIIELEKKDKKEK